MKNKLRNRLLVTLLMLSLGTLAAPSVAIKKCIRVVERANEKSAKSFIAISGSSVNSTEKLGGYSISASPNLLPACSIEPVTFHCITPYTSTGFWTFKWTVGFGWSNPGVFITTSNNIMLLPASATGTPSAVSVTAIYNNNNGNQSFFNVGSCPVFRSTVYKSDALITGAPSCSGSNIFNISGLKTGETVTWSVSDPSIASITSSSNTQATVTSMGNGSCDLMATITNTCNQTVQKKYPLHYGVPVLTDFTCSGIGRDFCSGVVEVESNTLPIIDLNDKITAIFKGLTAAEASNSLNWEWQRLTTDINVAGSRNVGRITMMNYGSTGIRVRASNSCGWSPWYDLYFDIVEIPATMQKMNQTASTMLLVYPNPAKETLFVEIKDSDLSAKQSKTGIAELFSLTNEPVAKAGISGNIAVLNIRDLKRGVYLLKIFSGSAVETRRVLIE